MRTFSKISKIQTITKQAIIINPVSPLSFFSCNRRNCVTSSESPEAKKTLPTYYGDINTLSPEERAELLENKAKYTNWLNTQMNAANRRIGSCLDSLADGRCHVNTLNTQIDELETQIKGLMNNISALEEWKEAFKSTHSNTQNVVYGPTTTQSNQQQAIAQQQQTTMDGGGALCAYALIVMFVYWILASSYSSMYSSYQTSTIDDLNDKVKKLKETIQTLERQLAQAQQKNQALEETITTRNATIPNQTETKMRVF
ncbi:MAG: hypothetical protein ACD_42C00170G0005 [uncultured bacterium]|nr:MAG: hypothetical protein ACD_42C00170G0005 [uncultured bacterium]OGT33839.1 MAG: hypothetical protein A3C44_04300 [Gammaproteobacteria bacterium RIFCSPHIGHO2_02_FULL_39_13]OGT48924.1 MAG: hypothetical protein A3E53_01350 [Gammaproteobacteria bacterium RIFCSPHIGHO2_12_FULL_39_24]